MLNTKKGIGLYITFDRDTHIVQANGRLFFNANFTLCTVKLIITNQMPQYILYIL